MTMHDSVTCMVTDMENVVPFAFCGGSACVFTIKSPDKSTQNEDALALIPCSDDAGVLVVADGLGGMRRGDLASQEVINSLVQSVKQKSADCNSLREAILDGVEIANETITNTIQGSASTVAIVEIQHREVRPYYVGDSAILITGQRGKVKYQSVPHSPVGYAIESGMLEADDAIHHDERHLISNAVGMAPMHVEIGPKITLAKRDTVLIASDGLFDNLLMSEIIEIICQGALIKAAEKLVSVCLSRMTPNESELPHKPDDMSFILFRPV